MTVRTALTSLSRRDTESARNHWFLRLGKGTRAKHICLAIPFGPKLELYRLFRQRRHAMGEGATGRWGDGGTRGRGDAAGVELVARGEVEIGRRSGSTRPRAAEADRQDPLLMV